MVPRPGVLRAARPPRLGLPFAEDAFDRVLTGHFYGRLPPDECAVFLAEARRVARELVVVDSALRDGSSPSRRRSGSSTTARGTPSTSAT